MSRDVPVTLSKSNLIDLVQQSKYEPDIPNKYRYNDRVMAHMVGCQPARELLAHGLDLQPRTIRDRLRAKLANKSKFN